MRPLPNYVNSGNFSDHCRPSDGILIPGAGPLMNPLRPFMLPEKLLAMHYVSHGWLARTLAVPFVLLAAALWRSGTSLPLVYLRP